MCEGSVCPLSLGECPQGLEILEDLWSWHAFDHLASCLEGSAILFCPLGENPQSEETWLVRGEQLGDW